MRLPSLILAASSLVLIGSVALAQATPGPVAAPAHGGVVQARQAGFHLALASFLSIKAGIARGDDVKTLALPAAALAGWGKVIPTMFPPGSDSADSDAMPNVWTDRAGFEAAAAAMSTTARALADAGKAGDTTGFAAKFAELGKACGDCHTRYRKPAPKP